MIRRRNIDAVHGLMLTYMIYGHIIDSFQNKIEPFFFMFMQWFFFNSGVFFKGYVIKSDFNKSVYTYVIYSAVGYILYLIYTILYNGNFNIQTEINEDVFKFLNHLTINGNGALWFLLSLFLVKCLFSFIHDRKLIYVAVVLGGGISYMLNRQGFIEPLWMANVATGVSFFGLGILLKGVQYNKYLFFVATAILITIDIKHPSYLHVHNNQLFCGSYILCFISALGGIIFYNNIFKITGGCKPLEYIGKNAMKLYVWHMPLLTISKILMILTLSADASNNKLYCGIITVVFLFVLMLFDAIRSKSVFTHLV